MNKPDTDSAKHAEGRRLIIFHIVCVPLRYLRNLRPVPIRNKALCSRRLLFQTLT